MRFFLILLSFFLLRCATKPSIAPAPFELKQLFYSLRQSNFDGYKCEVQSQLLKNLDDSEYDILFQKSFKRAPTLQEKGMLKKLKWYVINSNGKQEVNARPPVKEFPTPETQDLTEKITGLLTILNKVMTLTYLETFADRPDLSKVLIGDHFFQILNNENDVVAELDFNRQVYRIFFGPFVGKIQDQIEVAMTKLGSMQIPEMVELKFGDKTGKFYPHFEVINGFPQLKKVEVMLPQLGQIKAPFSFENCEYLKSSD